jgi:hypothetical protein
MAGNLAGRFPGPGPGPGDIQLFFTKREIRQKLVKPSFKVKDFF